MNHALVFTGGSSSPGSYWEEAISLVVRLGTLLQTLVIPLLLVIGAQFAVQLYNGVRREAERLLERHVDALQRDRQRLIEEIKLDLLRTLNKKGAKEEESSAVQKASEAECDYRSTIKQSECASEKSTIISPALSSTPSSGFVKNGSTTTGRSNQTPLERRRPATSPSSTKATEWIPTRRHRLDRKECSNIVNEIIYQIQSGTRTGEDCTSSSPGKSGIPEGTTQRSGNAEDSAVLRDVHNRNVVARMKTLFEQPMGRPQMTSVKFATTPERQPSPAAPESTPRRHFSNVVNILRRSEPNSSYGSRSISASLENLRPAGAAGYPKASSEPPTVIRMRRRIRSQQSLSESVEDILESERFSKRLSQYSISDLLDEDEAEIGRQPLERYSGEAKYDRVSRGLKTLSTFSLSELLQDDEMTTTVDGAEAEPEVVLRKSKPSATPATYRNAVDNIEQILIAENLSKDYWKYSISNLLDSMEEDGGIVSLQ